MLASDAPRHVLYLYRRSWRAAVLRQWIGPSVVLEAVHLKAAMFREPHQLRNMDAILVDWCPELASVIRQLDLWMDNRSPVITLTDDAPDQVSSAYAFGSDAVEAFPPGPSDIEAVLSTWPNQSNGTGSSTDLISIEADDGSLSTGDGVRADFEVESRFREQRAAPVNCDSAAQPRIVLDSERHECWIDGRPVHLAAIPFRFLNYLMDRDGICCHRQELMDEVWGSDYVPASDVVVSTVKRLRAVLRPSGLQDCLVTVRSVGYRFVMDDLQTHMTAG